MNSYTALLKSKPLPNTEQLRLIKLAQQNDIAARNKLVTTNLRLCYLVAQRYARRGHNIDDLMQQASLELIECINRFDVTKYSQASTFFWHSITGRIKTCITSAYKQGTREQVVLDDNIILNGSKEIKRIDTLQDTIFSTPEELVAANQLQSEFHLAIDKFAKTLTTQQRHILNDRILAEIPMRLEAIANEYGLTRERIRQIEARILTRLERYIKFRSEELIKLLRVRLRVRRELLASRRNTYNSNRLKGLRK